MLAHVVSLLNVVKNENDEQLTLSPPGHGSVLNGAELPLDRSKV